jgi:PBP1b-binding outer membrane lipoprotein LpoB
MIKQILLILILISTLTLTGCVERGHTITPTAIKQTIIKNHAVDSQKTKNFQKATNKVIAIESETQENSIDDSTKNTISGILVLIIGIIVFL